MARKIRIVDLSLPQKTYRQVDELADQMQVPKSELLREALKQYVASERRWGEEDVDRVIHEFRQENPRC